MNEATALHAEGCECVRCVGFTPGPNGTALVNLRHGAYSLVEIQGRAAEVADGLREAMREEGTYRPAFEPALALCSVVLVRVERASAAVAATDAALDEAGVSPLAPYLGTERGRAMDRLRQDLRRWSAEARSHLSELGLTPSSMAKLARDSGQALRARAALENLARHLEPVGSGEAES
jgi:hypothetical protein